MITSQQPFYLLAWLEARKAGVEKPIIVANKFYGQQRAYRAWSAAS